MSFKKIQLQYEKNPIFFLIPLAFLIFYLIGCDGSKTSSGSQAVTCTYTLSFDPNATQAQRDQAKAEFEASAKNSAGSAGEGITCVPTISWDESNPNQLLATVTINCYSSSGSNRSDSGAVRPPAQTKPPASRLSFGTLVKVKCSDE